MDEVADGLWIGDIQDAREGDTSRFNAVVTVCQDSVEDNIGCTYSYFNMSDGEPSGYGGECTYELFESAADTVYEHLTADDTVLVHCHHGVSRSTAISMAALARYRDIDAYRASALVKAHRTQANPNAHLFNHVKRYAAEHGNSARPYVER